MILIKDIEVIETDKDFAEILNMRPPEFLAVNNGKDHVEPMNITREYIYSRLFVGRDGQEVYLGFSKKVEKLLGLPMDCFERMQRTIDANFNRISRLESDVNSYKNKLDEILHANFWQRLKFLFKVKL